MKKYVFGAIAIGLLMALGLYLATNRPFKNFVKKSIEKFRYQQASNHTISDVSFTKIDLGDEVEGLFTSLVIGPDRKLYGGLKEGKIKRYLMQEDGSLKLEHTFYLFGDSAKLMIGIRFDPKAHKDSLCLWITYSESESIYNGPNWVSSLARIRLSNNSDEVMENTLIIEHLPRSASDHLTNSIDFGPDGCLYFSQGSNTSMGRADDEKEWLAREESLLSAAVLRLDLNKLPSFLPLDAKTPESGGTYNPYEADAPLQIYGTGLRNGYDLVWHSNGKLYSTVNGSMRKKNTPTSDPNSPKYVPLSKFVTYKGPKNIPAVTKVKNPQHDFLLRIEKGGYYGHPNPIRGEYILNRGEIDVENPEYKGIKADPNYRGFAFDFGMHASANGIIEYKSDRFDGKLKGMLIVTRLNIYHDLMVLKVEDDTKDVRISYDGQPLGLNGMNSPLDLIEDEKTGNIYVAEYGGKGKITLFVPNDKETTYITKSKIKSNKTSLAAKKVVAFSGTQLFEQRCTICHGESGQGGSGPSLIDDKWIYGNDPKKIQQIIENGSKNGMPPWKNILTETEIQTLTKYVSSLSKSPVAQSKP
jgi:glucose/arabinose dehydrogenase/cytochrome c5